MPTTEQGDKVTAAEQAAIARRTNAFNELGALQNQGMGAVLALLKVELPAGLPSGAQFFLQANPAGYGETIASLTVQFKQLSVVVDVLIDLLMKGEAVTLERFMTLCAQSAERNASLLRRAMLSQGVQQAANAGIVKPS
jgi:hypothetical protein